MNNTMNKRYGHAMTIYKGLPTVVGGVDSEGEPLKDLESFDGQNWFILDNEQLKHGRKNFGITWIPNSLLPSAPADET